MAVAALSDVKLYLRIDGAAEDSILAKIISGVESSLRAAISSFDDNLAIADFKNIVEQVELYMVAELYENRLPGKGINDYSYIIRSMILQLQLWG